jgi:hypothetical protein
MIRSINAFALYDRIAADHAHFQSVCINVNMNSDSTEARNLKPHRVD